MHPAGRVFFCILSFDSFDPSTVLGIDAELSRGIDITQGRPVLLSRDFQAQDQP